MKIKEGFVLKTVAGSNIVVPLSNPHFKSILTLNESGVMLFNKMNEQVSEQQLVDLILSEFDVSPDVARADVLCFVDSLRKAGILDE